MVPFILLIKKYDYYKIIYLYIYLVYQVNISFFINKIRKYYYSSFNFKNISFLKILFINFIIIINRNHTIFYILEKHILDKYIHI